MTKDLTLVELMGSAPECFLVDKYLIYMFPFLNKTIS